MKIKTKRKVKNTYNLHWFTADPFGRIVVLVVGNYKDALKKCDKIFKPKDKDWPISSESFEKILDDNTCKGYSKNCGRTVSNDIGNVFVWFPDYPTPGTLAHELMHAKDYILNSAGVTDTSGETDAYLLGAMYDHFFSVLEKDKMKGVAV